MWAGLWLGGLLMLGWLRARVPGLFAAWGAIGGGVGFALGASLQPWGKEVWATMPLGWWKAMELTFGALLGLAYGACAWRHRQEIADPDAGPVPSPRWPVALGLAVLAFTLAVLTEELLPWRFGYTVGAAALASLVLFSESLGWQTAITVTCVAFTADSLQYLELFSRPWRLACVTAVAVLVALIVARRARPGAMLLLLTWTAVAAAFRYLAKPGGFGPPQVTMLCAFVLMAAAATWGWRALARKG
jgi:hypothetical protein